MPLTPTSPNNAHHLDGGGTPPPAKRQRMTESQQPPASQKSPKSQGNTTTAKELYGAAARKPTPAPVNNTPKPASFSVSNDWILVKVGEWKTANRATIPVYLDKTTNRAFTHVQRYSGQPCHGATPNSVTLKTYYSKKIPPTIIDQSGSGELDRANLDLLQKMPARTIRILKQQGKYQTYHSGGTHFNWDEYSHTKPESSTLLKTAPPPVRPDTQTITLNAAQPSAAQNPPAFYGNEGVARPNADRGFQGDNFEPIPLNQINDYASFGQSDFWGALPNIANMQQPTLPLQSQQLPDVQRKPAGVTEGDSNSQHVTARASFLSDAYPDEVLVTNTAAQPSAARNQANTQESKLDDFMSEDFGDDVALDIDDTELDNFISELNAEEDEIDPNATDSAAINLEDVAREAQKEADNLDELLRDL